MYKQWKGKGVEFVGIGVLDSKDKSQDFVRRHGLTFPNGWDGDGKISKLYSFSYQPWWAVITKNGMLQKAAFGPTSENELISTIKTLTGQ